MYMKSYAQEVFAKIFGVGLFLLVLDAAKDYFYELTHYEFLASNLVPLSAIGLIICLVSIPFLMVEWLISPPGTQSKRIQLFQGAGNLCALMLLVAGWLSRDNAIRELPELAAVSFSSGGFLTAVIFGWMGKQIARFLSKKHIQVELSMNPNRTVESPTSITKSITDTSKVSNHPLINRVPPEPLTQN